MFMKNIFSQFLFINVVSMVAFAQTSFNKAILPPVKASSIEENQIWSKYCIGNRFSSEIPKPNYRHESVLAAVRKLALVSPYSYYFYSGPLMSYELKKGKELVDPPADFPNVQEVKSGRKNAHAFMTLLCGEFRDRPTLIEDKIRWVNRMHTLPAQPQKSINTKAELWPQIAAESYSRYIRASRSIFELKDQDQKSRGMVVDLGKYSEDYPVEPFSVCETKFIFKKYAEGKAQPPEDLDQLKRYRAEYKKFIPRCAEGDLDYIYDFRGDSNFKPNSPEANGMIWYSSTITNNCYRRNGQYQLKDAVAGKIEDKNICDKYFTSPFSYRWLAARAGLATWLLRDTKHDETFSDSKAPVFVLPHFAPMLKPFEYKMPRKAGGMDLYYLTPMQDSEGKYFVYDKQTWQPQYLNETELADMNAKLEKAKADEEIKVQESQKIVSDLLPEWLANKDAFWNRADLGFNHVTGLGTKNANKELAYERLRDAVNRHTDWYASGYDDSVGIMREQAYSPLVASSYEMSASDAFTAPGTTVNAPADGCKHWMFVFKLKKSQWYNTLSIKSKTPVDFNTNWFDETSLGTNGLADSEHAFDRLGTALEGEMDSILYLHKLNTGGQVDPQCGYEQMGLPIDQDLKNKTDATNNANSEEIEEEAAAG